METQDVCYTQEVALEKAIEMETKSGLKGSSMWNSCTILLT